MNLEILYEDNHLIAINKPEGMLSQPDHTGEPSAIEFVKDFIKKKYNKPGNVFLGTVHRLDRPVTGVLLFAKTSKGADRLSEQFKTRRVSKFYLAIVEGIIKPSEWEILTGRYLRQGDITRISNDKTLPLVSLAYKSLATLNGQSLLLVELHSGKKHQIRAQLSHLGLPIIGDQKYGSVTRGSSIALHSWCLECTHPTQETAVRIIAPIPESFKRYQVMRGIKPEEILLEYEKRIAETV